MVTKTVIGALAILALVNRSLSLSCRPCHEVYCGPSPTCRYGTTLDVCSCCDECAKGPGETCGGPWGSSGTCSNGLECQLDPNDPGSDFNKVGTCRKPVQTDPCKLPPNSPCTLNIQWDCDGNQYNNGCEFYEAKCRNPQLKTPPCGRGPCEDISPNCAANKHQCTTLDYVKENCQKTCGLCPQTPGVVCRDISHRCPSQVQNCHTHSYVRAKCQKSCGLCTPHGK